VRGFEGLGVRETEESRRAREEAKKKAEETAWEARIRAGGARVEAEQLALLAGFLPDPVFFRERSPEDEARLLAMRKAMGKRLEGGGGGPLL